ncbi:MAG: 2OG-Fe(II) oxygenase [Dongiaceae bacterium]
MTDDRAAPILTAAPKKMSKSAIEAHAFLPKVALCAGDRFPDFYLPDQHGAVRAFLERAKGNGIVLLVDVDDRILRQASEAAAGFAAAQLDPIGLLGGSEEEVAGRASRVGVSFPLLVDPAGKIRQQLRQMTGKSGTQPFCLLLDRQQRIVDIAAMDQAAAGDPCAWALARWKSEPAPEEGRRLAQFAPVLIVPNVLTPDDCQTLMARWEVMGHEEGMVHSIVKGNEISRIHKTMKSRRDHEIGDMALQRSLAGVIGRRLAPELERAFNFSRFRFDRFIITCYEAAREDHFRRHRDNQSPSTADRRFALTLNLNTDDYDGGELIFPEYGNHLYSPPAGGAILFSCSLLHEALPVRRGRRFTLLSFLRN